MSRADVAAGPDREPPTELVRFDMSLGTGLGKLRGRVFRIGHPGFFKGTA